MRQIKTFGLTEFDIVDMLDVVLNRTSDSVLRCSSVAVLTLGIITECDATDATCNGTTVPFIREVLDFPSNAIADLMNATLQSNA